MSNVFSIWAELCAMCVSCSKRAHIMLGHWVYTLNRRHLTIFFSSFLLSNKSKYWLQNVFFLFSPPKFVCWPITRTPFVSQTWGSHSVHPFRVCKMHIIRSYSLVSAVPHVCVHLNNKRQILYSSICYDVLLSVQCKLIYVDILRYR
jgi:hypothetical protein